MKKQQHIIKQLLNEQEAEKNVKQKFCPEITTTPQQQNIIKKKIFVIKENKGTITQYVDKNIENYSYIKIQDKQKNKRYEGYATKEFVYYGYGKLYHSNNSVFQGYFENGKKIYGIQKSQGQTYTGNFSDNFPHGLGRITFENGEYFNGNFWKGQYEGFGVYLSIKNGQKLKCKGYWKQGKRDGAFIIKNINDDQCVNPQIELEYNNSYLKKIIYFQGILDMFGYTSEHFQLLDTQKILPIIKYQSLKSIQSDKLLNKSKKINKPKKQNKKQSKKLETAWDPEFLKRSKLQNEFQYNTNYSKSQCKLTSQVCQMMLYQKLKQLENDNKDDQNHQQLECSICLEEIQDNESITIFPCKGLHTYHHSCIKNWLKQKKQQQTQNSCPECRWDLQKLDVQEIYGDSEGYCIVYDINNLNLIQEDIIEEEEKQIQENKTSNLFYDEVQQMFQQFDYGFGQRDEFSLGDLDLKKFQSFNTADLEIIEPFDNQLISTTTQQITEQNISNNTSNIQNTLDTSYSQYENSNSNVQQIQQTENNLFELQTAQ